jgi:hypothetical protein
VLQYQGLQATSVEAIVDEISRLFKVPKPRVVWGSQARYYDGTIELPSNVDPKLLVRMVAHEMAHHIHVHYGVPVTLEEAEAFARAFEEAWVKSRGYNYPFIPCMCGYRIHITPSDTRAVCPRCGTVYAREYRYPSPISIPFKAILMATVTGLGTYYAFTFLQEHPRFKERPRATALVAGAIPGFILGLIF